jgi:AbrB family looped-hinge helix DNA binding protein
MESAKVGKRGTIVVPAKHRKRFGLDEGSFVTAEARDAGILLRPAAIVPIEKYSHNARPNFFFPRPPAFPTTAAPSAKSNDSASIPTPSPTARPSSPL